MRKDYSKVTDKVLGRIVPSDSEVEKVQTVARESLEKANEVMNDFDSEVKVLIEGSVAKNTWIAGEADIDVFVLFPLSYKDADLEKVSLPLLKNIAEKVGGDYDVKYAQHPYVRTQAGGIPVEFVPGFQSKPTQIISAVDRTPYHTAYVSRHLEDTNQVRLLKQFFKGVGVYGAEQSTLGFSGYLCELLVIKYGNFLNALENIARWRSEDLIVPDPTDPDRNVAAAVSKKKLNFLIRSADAFLEYPSVKFFFPDPAPVLTQKELRELLESRYVTLVSMDKPEQDEEILNAQLRSFTRKLSKFLDRKGFNCLNAWYNVNDRLWVMFEVEDMNLPETKLREGPPVSMKKASEQFKEACEDKGVDVWESEGRWQAYVPREATNLNEALELWLDKVKGPKYVVKTLPSCDPIDRECMISDYPQLPDEVKQFITVSLLDLPPWEW